MTAQQWLRAFEDAFTEAGQPVPEAATAAPGDSRQRRGERMGLTPRAYSEQKVT